MKIKNKARLIARAEHHKDADIRLVGDVFLVQESDRPLRACAIGCLALPVSPTAQRRHLRTLLESGWVGRQCRARLEGEFGLLEALQDHVEAVFTDLEEKLEDKSEAERMRRLGDFLVRFAKALPEGVEIDERTMDDAPYDHNGFLRWLRAGCPESVTA